MVPDKLFAYRGVDGDWHAHKKAGRLRFYCAIVGCKKKPGECYYERRLLNWHRREQHGELALPNVQLKGPNPKTKYSRGRYEREKNDNGKWLDMLSINQRRRLENQACSKEGVNNKSMLSDIAKVEIEDKMLVYDSEESRQERIRKRDKREARRSCNTVQVMAFQDAFCVLPDYLISFILSKMPIKDSVRSSILSKRWRSLYTQMPTLHFSLDAILGDHYRGSFDLHTMSKVENIVSNVLLLHSHSLEALFIGASYKDLMRLKFSHENLNKWIRYAACYNVQHLTLSVSSDSEEMSPSALFSCSQLVSLHLTGYVFTSLPINFLGFPHLISCHLDDVELTDESLISLISLCPLLQKLEIIPLSELDNVIIISSTMEHLNMQNVDCLSVDCPKLKNLEGLDIMDLRVNGVRFYELSQSIRKLKMHCGDTLTHLYIYWETSISASRFLDIVGNFQSLEELDIDIYRWKREAEMEIEGEMEMEEVLEIDIPLLDLLHRLSNLNSLSIKGILVQWNAGARNTYS